MAPVYGIIFPPKSVDIKTFVNAHPASVQMESC